MFAKLVLLHFSLRFPVIFEKILNLSKNYTASGSAGNVIAYVNLCAIDTI